MTPIDIPDLQAALEAARIAGDYIRREYDKFVPIPDAPANISTDIDRGSQELILQYLHQRFPDDGLCAEENTATISNVPNARRVWVVDPIDGTRGFARKNGEFSVMIGLILDGASIAGVVLEPVTMKCTFAAKGHGCWLSVNDSPARRCQVRSESDLSKSILVQSHSRPGKISLPVEKIKPGSVREMYSAGVKMAVVARGEADLYVNTYSNFSDWDICAGHILVTEAGGVVSGLGGEIISYGKPGFKQTHGLLAASQAIHAAAVGKLTPIERL